MRCSQDLNCVCVYNVLGYND